MKGELEKVMQEFETAKEDFRKENLAVVSKFEAKCKELEAKTDSEAELDLKYKGIAPLYT